MLGTHNHRLWNMGPRVRGDDGSRIAHNRKRVMAGILDFTRAAPRGGLLPFANAKPIDDSPNALLRYLARALQSGNLGPSICHRLAGAPPPGPPRPPPAP